MMKYWLKKRTVALVLCMSMLCSAGCGSDAEEYQGFMVNGSQQEPDDGGEADDETTRKETKPEENGGMREEPAYTSEDISTVKCGTLENEEPVDENLHAITDFGVELLKTTLKKGKEGTNVLVSPLSILMALAMTANGAEGETKTQMEAVLGENLNPYLNAYRSALPSGEKYKLHLANAIWFKDMDLMEVKGEFLQTNADYYDAAIYKAPFDDSTLKDINNWVEYHTDGMIQNILENIPEDAAMYLVNALSFDAEWSDIYTENQVRNGTFTKEDGTEQTVEMMYSNDSYYYLEDELVTGFIKYYYGRNYAFVALLPKEGVSVAEYVESLTGEHVTELLENASMETVETKLPKFETEYSITLNDVLKQMGMINAFDEEIADFSAMATVPPEWNISISKVLHKTFITVDERGTKAGAATVVQMDCTTSSMEQEVPKRVYLDRPFVYLLIDWEKKEPFFMGTMMDVEK